jgi:hypothetical protein
MESEDVLTQEDQDRIEVIEAEMKKYKRTKA